MTTTASGSASGSIAQVFASTARGLAAPRRLVPILTIGIPVVLTQTPSSSPWAVPVGLAMVLGSLAVGPTSYRLCFGRAAKGPLALRFVAFLALGVAVLGAAGVLLPWLVDLHSSFLTSDSSLLTSLGLHYVGGFGLGRDLELEDAVEAERSRAEEQTRRAEAARIAAEHAQLLAIRSHLDPHFLFNTLNAIAEWCREDGALAERAILELSAMLRTILEGIRTPSWPLAREVELARALGRLYAARDPERFRYEEELDAACLALEVPPLLALPVLENAWKHGPARNRRGPVRLVVRALSPEAGVELLVSNGGAFEGLREGGEGVRMVRERLALSYGERGSITWSTDGEPPRTTVRIAIRER